MRLRQETEKEQQRLAEAKNAELEAKRRKLQQEVEQKRKLRQQQQRERELAAEDKKKAAARIEEAEKKRKDVERELKEKELQMQHQQQPKPPKSTTTTTVNNRSNRPEFMKVPLKDDSDDGEPKSSLSRSHSSPNIAKMFDDDAAFSSGPLSNAVRSARPNFSRTNKPMSSAEISQARNRDFQPIWSTSQVKGRTGLKNLGNTCYMNSILQCLSNFNILVTYFMDDKYLKDINDTSETRGNVAIEFAALVRSLWSGMYKSIAPVDFKKAIGRYRECFRGNEQQDAHELLSTLMGWLHNDTNEVKSKARNFSFSK